MATGSTGELAHVDSHTCIIQQYLTVVGIYSILWLQKCFISTVFCLTNKICGNKFVRDFSKTVGRIQYLKKKIKTMTTNEVLVFQYDRNKISGFLMGNSSASKTKRTCIQKSYVKTMLMFFLYQRNYPLQVYPAT
jgi:hypothetical protein